ncbi:hypothetical protein EXN66_Car008439 [Channa argus]|uniref:Uncharacterized protein n=1 Tax=Channa argus TaxID=215402 RepID=A0A6G1PRF7_CHAAH|nr:hypothetical protein EXN66_Car008439 [Channa argus]
MILYGIEKSRISTPTPFSFTGFLCSGSCVESKTGTKEQKRLSLIFFKVLKLSEIVHVVKHER